MLFTQLLQVFYLKYKYWHISNCNLLCRDYTIIWYGQYIIEPNTKYFMLLRNYI